MVKIKHLISTTPCNITYPKKELEIGNVRSWRKTQFVACTVVYVAQFLTGIAMAHSSSLIPQLEAADSEIPLTRDESTWVASVFTVTVVVGSILATWIVNGLGRVNAVKAVVFPTTAAYAVIATAQSFWQLMVGRAIIGVSVGIGVNAAMLYSAEVAEKEIRGILGCVGIAISSLGSLCSYVLGAYLPWRAAAWCCCVPPLVLWGLLFAFSAESPVWLRDQGKKEAARMSSMYFYNDPEKVLSVPTKECDSKRSVSEMTVMLFTTSAGLKPLILINILFVFQQLVGVYTTIYYGVTFVQESGSDIDPYVVTIAFGVARLLAGVAASLCAGRLGRRLVMIASSLVMAACMFGSAFASSRVLSLQAAKAVVPEWLSWAVIVCIVLNVTFSSLGPHVLPWSMIAEIFPHEVRPVAQSINVASSHLGMFVFLKLYPTLSYWLGGSVGMQLLFAGSSLVLALFVWVFMLETRGLTLSEIEEYFKHNSIYLGQRTRALSRSVVVSTTANSNTSGLGQRDCTRSVVLC